MCDCQGSSPGKSKEIKVVLDTNIWVSAWLWRGIPGHLIRLARKSEITLCSSEALLAEFEHTLSYGKITQKMQSLNFTKEQLIIGKKSLKFMKLVN